MSAFFLLVVRDITVMYTGIYIYIFIYIYYAAVVTLLELRAMSAFPLPYFAELKLRDYIFYLPLKNFSAFL